MAQRLKGQVPDSVYVTTDWNLGRAFTRIVLPDDLQVDDLELRFLAGLDVVIAHHANDARLGYIVDAVLRVNPRLLNALDVDAPCCKTLKRGDL